METYGIYAIASLQSQKNPSINVESYHFKQASSQLLKRNLLYLHTLSMLHNYVWIYIFINNLNLGMQKVTRCFEDSAR